MTSRSRSAAYSPDGRLIVTASEDGTARVWDAVTGAQVLLLHGHTDKVDDAAFSTDGRLIVTVGADGTARVWTAPGRSSRGVVGRQTGPVHAVAFSPDGKLVLDATADGKTFVWRRDTGRPVATLEQPGQVLTAAFSPDGGSIVTAGDDAKRSCLGCGDRPADRGAERTSDSIYDAAFSANGDRIVTSGEDGTARVWNADGGPPILILRQPGGGPRRLLQPKRQADRHSQRRRVRPHLGYVQRPDSCSR